VERPAASRLQFGDVTLVPDERLVLRDGQPIPVTPKAFDLLLVLTANPGRLLTKEQLMEAVWADTAVEESNLSYHVFAIRKALGDTAENGQLIETVPKRGYRFTPNVTRLNESEDRPGVSAEESDPKPNDSDRLGDANVASLPDSGPVEHRVSGLHNTRPGLRSALWFAAGALRHRRCPTGDHEPYRPVADAHPGTGLAWRPAV
jgi:DNA-binding winged helix-turn-helix (wHTH) protein